MKSDSECFRLHLVSVPGIQLRYSAVLTGTVNGDRIAASGSGSIDEGSGKTEGMYKLEAIPDGFSPLFLTSVLITGYPNASACLDDAPNPFKGCSYEYEREIRFHDNRTLRLTTQCRLKDDFLLSCFYLTGESPSIDLQAVNPILESWDAVNTEDIEGLFRICWTRNGGSVLSAEARSRYHQMGMLLSPMQRSIEITADLTGAVLRLVQLSSSRRRCINDSHPSIPTARV